MKHTLQEHFETAAALFADTPVEGFKMLMAKGDADYVQQRDSFLQTQLKDKNLLNEIVADLRSEKPHIAKTEFLIGEAYALGDRPKHAFDAYTNAAGEGYAPAKFALARQLISGVKDPQGEAVIANPDMAVAWLTEAADQNNYAPAQHMLGKLHRAGLKNSEGEVILPVDPVQALDWFRKAADQGIGEASAKTARYSEVLNLIKTKLLDDPRADKIFAHGNAKNQAAVEISQALKEVLNPQEGHSAEPSSSWAQKHRKNHSPLPELRTTAAHDAPLIESIIKSLEKRSANKSVSDAVKEGIEGYLRKVRNVNISAVDVAPSPKFAQKVRVALLSPIAAVERESAEPIRSASPLRALSPIVAIEGGFAEQVRAASPERASSPMHSELSDSELVQLPSPKSAARTPSPTHSDRSTESGEWQMVVSRGAAGGKGNAR